MGSCVLTVKDNSYTQPAQESFCQELSMQSTTNKFQFVLLIYMQAPRFPAIMDDFKKEEICYQNERVQRGVQTHYFLRRNSGRKCKLEI